MANVFIKKCRMMKMVIVPDIYIKISDEELKQRKVDSVDDLQYLASEEVKRHRKNAISEV